MNHPEHPAATPVPELRAALGHALATLTEVANHLTLHAQANAALHRTSDHVIYPPLHAAVLQTISDIHATLHHTGHQAADPAAPPPVDLPRVTRLIPPPPANHADRRT